MVASDAAAAAAAAADAEEAVLARATELYSEGLALEEAHEPQLALDRYRRAVRMADERKIVERLRLTMDCAAPAPAPKPAKGPAAEEDFQLWRALHESKLEAEARGTEAAPAAASSTGAPAAACSQASAPSGGAASGGTTFNPPKRRTREQSPEDSVWDEDHEEQDRLALRALHGKMRLGKATHAEEEQETSEQPRRSRSKTSSAAVAEEESCALLAIMLPEVLPEIFSFLDAYGLDRLARGCGALRGLSRGAAAWRDLATSCLPKEVCSSLECKGDVEGEPWRQLLLRTPRLRRDGIYIAPCGYHRKIQKGSSLTDHRESMYVRYFRLLRVLPDDPDRGRQVLFLTTEAEINTAVDALKSYPIGRAATCAPAGGAGKSTKSTDTISSAARKLHEKVIVGTHKLDSNEMVACVKYTDARNEYIMEFKLLHGRKDGSRQNCRLTWERYEFTSLNMPQDGGSFELRREQHYSPFAFARVKALEHLL